ADNCKWLERILTDEKLEKDQLPVNSKVIHTYLQHVCKNCSTSEVVELLKTIIDNMTRLNIFSYYRKTLLHQACQNKNCWHTIVKLLLSNKEVDINETDENGQTPLHYACLNKINGERIVNYLASLKA